MSCLLGQIGPHVWFACFWECEMKNGEDGRPMLDSRSIKRGAMTPKPGASGGCSFSGSMPTMCTTLNDSRELHVMAKEEV
jgi:hypothetical protein